MEGLARVNLFVGRNNSGKTAVLEGIQFLASGGDPSVISEVASRRGEIIFTRPETGSQVDIGHFFHGHACGPNATFTLAGDNSFLPVTVKTYVNQEGSGVSPQSMRQGRPHGLALKITVGSAESKEDPRFPISREGGVDFDASLPPRYRMRGGSRRPVVSQAKFVGTDSLDTFELASMWDEVIVQGREKDVAAAMRILDDSIESLHFLTGMMTAGYFPSRGGIVIGMKGLETRVPLGSMGDGMRRLMALATSLAFTREGNLFVDEIDTGLHYSVMSDMWKLVVAKAVESNTQVFATTHSWDCIKGLSDLCQKDVNVLPSVAIHKIDRSIPHSIAFSGESVVKMVRADIDMR